MVTYTFVPQQFELLSTPLCQDATSVFTLLHVFGQLLSVGTICLNIGPALAERVRQGEVGGCTTLADSVWQLVQLPVEKAWSMPGGLYICLPTCTNEHRKCSFHLAGTPFLPF